jgi:hypothetical protein
MLANREQSKDSLRTDDYIRYTRQDIRMVVWLLGAVVVMLGIIADRIEAPRRDQVIDGSGGRAQASLSPHCESLLPTL